MSVKGFGRHTNGKVHPVHGRKGVREKDLKVGDDVMFSRIPVGQENVKRYNLQKLIAMDMTPQKNIYPYQRTYDEAVHEMNENNPDWDGWKKKVDVADFEEWVGGGGASGEARYYKILDFSDFPVITTKTRGTPEYYTAIHQVETVLDREARKKLGDNYGVAKDEHERQFMLVTDSREYN